MAADLSNWDIIGRLLLAALVGGAIGFERETDGQDAGLRTHLMLALGAAVFGVVSVGAWDHFNTGTQNSIFRADVTRVASYVAAGIGFVGGGAIVKHAGSVKGLTTAASLWVAGAVGLAAGVGFWLPAVAGTVIGYLSLAARVPLRRIVQYVSDRSSPSTHMPATSSTRCATCPCRRRASASARGTNTARRSRPSSHRATARTSWTSCARSRRETTCARSKCTDARRP
jgi:putative Mg2+ transporter-C (MgtC) family protein